MSAAAPTECHRHYTVNACSGHANETENRPDSVVDASTVNAFKARLDKFWQHQLVKFDFTADLMGTRNRSEEVIT